MKDFDVNQQRALFGLPPLESINKDNDELSGKEALDINQIMIKERSKKIIMGGLPDKKTIEQSIAKYVGAEGFAGGTAEYAEKLFAGDNEKIDEYLMNSLNYQRELELEINNTKNTPLALVAITSDISNRLTNIFTI